MNTHAQVAAQRTNTTFARRAARTTFPLQLRWLLAGLVLAFAIPFLFTDLIQVPRDVFYALYVGAVAAFVGVWARETQAPIRSFLTRNWRLGVSLGVLAAVALMFVVLREPSSPHPHGWTFVGAILWRGVVYGATDGVLLSVFPILAVFGLFAGRRLRDRSRKAVAGIGALALAVSLLFSAVYHLGYPDFRSGKVAKPVAGDLIWSAPTLLTLSPLGAPIAHIGLHVSALVHDYQSDLFLPPHRAAGTLERPGFQRLLDRIAADPSIAPGAVGFVLTPDGSWSGAAGLSNVEANKPMSPNDAFRIFSLTKSYVATVVLQLVQERRLRLSDTIGDLLPTALPPDKQAITVRQLLSHESGLYDSMSDGLGALTTPKTRVAFLASIRDPAIRREVTAVIARVRRDPSTVFPAKIWVDIAGSQPLYFKPGTGYHYSNPGYVLLGWVVERIEGRPLASVLKERIFDPLGLQHTWYLPGPTLPEPYAHGYILPRTFGSTFFPPTNRPIDGTRVTLGLAGASSVVATAEDVARFYSSLLEGKLLEPRTLHQLMLPERMGIGLIPTSCGGGYGHTGAFLDYKTAALTSTDGKTTAVLLANGRGPNADAWIDNGVGKLFCGA
ncbi:MAG TPA: serine hydrolase domain-containing protein [Gaiellaceae bacterium]